MASEQLANVPKWLLNALVEFRIDPITLRSGKDFLEEDFNCEIPEFDLGRLVQVIFINMREGNLEITDSQENPLSLDNPDALSTLIARGHEQTYWLGLTDRGGSEWECLCTPRWDDFVNLYLMSGAGEDEEVCIESLSRDKNLEAYAYIKSSDYIIIPSSEKWLTLSPWEATYWKTFPTGLRLTLRGRNAAPSEMRSNKSWYSDFFKWNACF